MKVVISKIQEIIEKGTDSIKAKIIEGMTILALTGALGTITFPTTKDGKKEAPLEQYDKPRSFELIR